MKHITAISVIMVLIMSLPLVAGEIHDAARQGDLNAVQNLVNGNPGLLQEKDATGSTPLHIAAISGHTNVVEFLISKGVAVDIGDNENTTPLDVAAQNGRLEVVEFLVSKGANVNHKDNNDMCPILWAAMSGNVDLVQFLLSKGADINAKDNQGMTTLHQAAYRRHIDLARFLVDKGMNVNVLKNNGSAPLHGAALNGDLDMVKLLISKGAKADITNSGGYTPFLSAVAGCQKATAEYLVSKDVNPNSQSSAGATGIALITALYNCNDDEVARWIIESGAEVNSVEANGEAIPLMIVAFRGNAEIAELLIQHGAKVDVKQGGLTPLWMAVNNGSKEVAEVLIKNGANVHIKSDRGVTLLMTAAVKGEDDLIELLLANGARINLKDKDYGRTALHFAAIKGYASTVELLVNNGAEINATDKNGDTALNLASKYGHQNVAQLLMSQGGTANGVVEYNFGKSALLGKKGAEKEATLWYLGNCGYAVKTKNHFLVFDYWQMDAPPANPGLANGHINPAELAGQKVTVFVSHEHADHFDTTIFGWAEALENVTYIYGFQPELIPQYRQTGYPGPEYQYVGPRSALTIDGMDIVTIQANDAGVGFLVKVDGLTLYHAGDHAGWLENAKEGYTKEIDYLATKTRGVDLAFLNVTGCHAHGEQPLWEGTCYTLMKLNPRVIIPTHGIDREYVYRDYAQRLQREKNGITVYCPENCGDKFSYSN